MLNELECVWAALFGECIGAGLRHNEHLLNSSVASEFAAAERDGVAPRGDDPKLYSLKRVLQSILDNADPELTDVGVEAVFRAREELVNSFKIVAQDQGFESTLSDAIKLIIIDALNRKVKERNPEFVASTADISNVKVLREYLERSDRIKQLRREIQRTQEGINSTNRDIQQMRAALSKVEDYISALSNRR